MKPVILATAFAIATLSAPTARAGEFDYAGRVGIVYLDPEGTPLLETSTVPDGQRVLEPGTTMAVVVFGSAPGGDQRLVEAKTVGLAVSVPPPLSRPLYGDNPTDSARYKLAIIGGDALTAGAVGLGIIGAADRCGASSSMVSCNLEPGGPPQFFRLCASHEGLHFSIWSGKPLEDARRWHAYYYLGYDVEPDCTDQDY